MDKIFISNQIKLEILKICGLPVVKPYNLPGQTTINVLKQDNDGSLCRTLENKLQEIATSYNTGKIITQGAVTAVSSVNHCIKLVLA
jgi:ligand-binding sensor domain-containing protein